MAKLLFLTQLLFAPSQNTKIQQQHSSSLTLFPQLKTVSKHAHPPLKQTKYTPPQSTQSLRQLLIMRCGVIVLKIVQVITLKERMV